MGTQKDREIEEQDDWDRIAREKGYICDMCGSVILKEEYDASSNLCGACRHMTNKDD